MSKQSKNVNVEINKGAAGFALLVCAISGGYTAHKFDIANPLVAAVICGVAGFAIGYIRNSYAAIVILIAVAVFAFTYSRPWPGEKPLPLPRLSSLRTPPPPDFGHRSPNNSLQVSAGWHLSQLALSGAA